MTTPTIRVRRTPPPEFGPTLLAGRIAAGLSGREAARRVGITASYLRALETGTRCPSASVAELIADVLELDAEARAVILAGAVSDAGRDHPRRAKKTEDAPLGLFA
jgi:transcriptional regulator with XRE-family HTH domain